MEPPLADLTGLQLGEVVVPEPVLEIILSKISVGDIVNFNRVCRIWKDISTRLSFWKLVFEYNKIPWNVVPEYIKVKENSWIVMFMACKKDIFTKNFILNHSGASELEGWQIIENGPDFRFENPPIGCDSLPEDPMFPDCNQCFSTSFLWASKSQVIDLWSNGLNPAVMELLLPFRIELSERYTARFDCGAEYTLSGRFKSEDSQVLRSKQKRAMTPPTMEWKRMQINFDFVSSNHSDLFPQMRTLTFKHRGKDTQFWAGNYGAKFAHACVRIIPLGEQPDYVYTSEDNDDSVSSEDVGAQFFYEYNDHYGEPTSEEEDYEDADDYEDDDIDANRVVVLPP